MMERHGFPAASLEGDESYRTLNYYITVCVDELIDCVYGVVVYSPKVSATIVLFFYKSYTNSHILHILREKSILRMMLEQK